MHVARFEGCMHRNGMLVLTGNYQDAVEDLTCSLDARISKYDFGFEGGTA